MNTFLAGRLICFVVILGLVDITLNQNHRTQQFTQTIDALSRSLSDESSLPKYDQGSIENYYYQLTLPVHLHSALLVFDGQMFRAYLTQSIKWLSFRYITMIPLMANALREKYPDRFKTGQPVFQMIFTVSDLISTSCVNPGHACLHTQFMPPIISFSTEHRDMSVLPTVKTFPNPYFVSCLYNYKFRGEKTCQWQEVNMNLDWDDLDRTIVWRGSDFLEFLPMYDDFNKTRNGWIGHVFTEEKVTYMTKMGVIEDLMNNWDNLTPRWQAAVLTIKEEVERPLEHHWINVKFTGTSNQKLHDVFEKRGISVATDKEMDSVEMSKYRYQIDLGGGGGTTWQGTLTKLSMPGVLFHHETPTKDWFYDLMKPWIHYIPVSIKLDDLRDKYDWAESHPDEAKKIAEEGTKLADYIKSETYMKQVYEEFFETYLGKVVDAYQPNDMSWEDSLARYRKKGVPLYQISECPVRLCRTEWGEGKFIDHF